MAELVSRGSLLWLVFAPLVRDASLKDAAAGPRRGEAEGARRASGRGGDGDDRRGRIDRREAHVREWLMSIVDED
ncbi:MAG: hypothetical protein R3A52_26835 [Polyangiales bacterium]